jgi:glycosyltransferase involved in cell wall biosynthesis
MVAELVTSNHPISPSTRPRSAFLIHFFPLFSNDPSGSPFAQELVKAGVAYRLFGQALKFHYRTRLGLVLLGWPRLILFACRSARRSLFRSDPRPDAVALSSHFEVVIFGLARLLLSRESRPSIVLLGFIYTSRPSPLARHLRELYFGLVFRLADTIICHSAVELHEYGKTFPAAKHKFRYLPYGLYVSGEENHRFDSAAATAPREPAYVLAAGRSGRDYATLVKAVEGTGIPTHIVCDREAALASIDLPPHVTVLARCYGKEYLQELENAAVVVVPLLVDDISAGQMVLIQAMAYRKPIIVTRTATIQEYVQHGRECLLVERSDPVGLQQAIRELLADRELAARLANSARQAYEQRYCMRAYVTNVVSAIQDR